MAKHVFRNFARTAMLVWGASALATAFAQDSVLKLQAAIERAQARAPNVASAIAGVRAADAGVQVAKAHPNPSLGIEAENVLGSGRYSGFGGGDKTYSVSVPIELGGKREARTRVAEAERVAATVGVATSRADLTLRVTQAFITLAANQRRLELGKASLELAERAAKVARERVKAGKASPIDEQRAEVLRINAQVKAARAERAVETASSTLARLLGSSGPVTISAAWFDEANVVPGTVPAGQSLAMAAADADIAAAQARVAAARSARVPDVTVSVGARRIGESHDKAAVLSLSVPLPIFNSGSGELARAHAEFDRAEAQRAAVSLDYEQALLDAKSDVANAQAAAEAAGPALAAAGEAARIARIGYAAGKFSQLDLIEAERALTESREASINALAALHDARARLARLNGSTASLYKD
jgi:cobalt-zinc-cadmium efflux system outer membrane protein